jgi:DNA invertase Pin-like site-specific DNA recombinase
MNLMARRLPRRGHQWHQGARRAAWTECTAQGRARREFDIVAAWSVCRLGRSLPDLIGLLGELRSRDIDLYLHQQALDTSTPSGRMLFGMPGVFSEFERAMIRIVSSPAWIALDHLASAWGGRGRRHSRCSAFVWHWMKAVVCVRPRGC